MITSIKTEIKKWFDESKVSKEGYFYKNATVMCEEVIDNCFGINGVTAGDFVILKFNDPRAWGSITAWAASLLKHGDQDNHKFIMDKLAEIKKEIKEQHKKNVKGIMKNESH